MGILNTVGPTIASSGYVQIRLRIKYESHGVADIIATFKRANMCECFYTQYESAQGLTVTRNPIL